MNTSLKTCFRIGLLAASLQLAACATQVPDWLDNPAAAYPDTQYLSATGAADERQVAADRALANLAKIFEVQIADTSLDFSAASVSSGEEGVVSSNEQRLSRTITTEARQVVAGAKVVEYYETEQGRVHALAVLDRQAAASRFRQSILQSDRKVDSLLQYASRQAPNVVAALNALNQARLEQIRREQVNSHLMVVDDGRGVKSSHTVASIEETLRRALATLRCDVESSDPSVKAELQRAVSQLGIQIQPGAQLRFTGLMDATAPEQRQGWYWIRGSYELMLSDGDQVLAKQRWPVKASATAESLVGQRLRDTVNRELPGQLFEMLTRAGDAGQ